MVADDVEPAEVVANLHTLAVALQQDMQFARLTRRGALLGRPLFRCCFRTT